MGKKQINVHDYDSEEWDDEELEQTFQPLRKQAQTSSSLQGDRRQREKEWGRSIRKFHKERERFGNKKP
jgi:acyl-homoserine lactone acylase PvdQ